MKEKYYVILIENILLYLVLGVILLQLKFVCSLEYTYYKGNHLYHQPYGNLFVS